MFSTYTGNAILNNALMTIEALARLKHVSGITPELILELYQKVNLKNLNLRLKSYTMLFTKNGPLKNDEINGEKIYDELFRYFTQNVELEGERQCEISGLRFTKTFDILFGEVLTNIGITKKEIAKKDTTINRTWFPLIGGLGSDAQALPQAKFSVQIHPILIPILQFLPLSTVLYRGGVLLIDSSNFEFSKEFIARNVKDVTRRIETTQEGGSIENLKDFSKGNYLLRAIDILDDKNFDFQDDYTDLNLWSFSNSGTGASCEIERVPSSLIRKILRLRKNPVVEPELNKILSNSESPYSFLEALESNQEWYGLYPNVYGSGKIKVESDGVSVPFLEAYYQEIKSPQKIGYAKYLAFLVDKYKTDSFAKYLSKKDAWRDHNFKTDLYVVLVKATENGEWSLIHHLDILDDANEVPVKNNIYNILKITHFYYYKKSSFNQLPQASDSSTEAKKIMDWLIAIIQTDSRKDILVKSLINSQTYASTGYSQMLYRASRKSEVDLGTVFYTLYNEQFKSTRYGFNELLRIFFSQPEQVEIELTCLEKDEKWELEKNVGKWFEQFAEFASDYQRYYFQKYSNTETGINPIGKFQRLVEGIPEDSGRFLTWFYNALENTNRFLIGHEFATKEKWSDSLLYSPYGEYLQSFAHIGIKLSLIKCIQSHHTV